MNGRLFLKNVFSSLCVVIVTSSAFSVSFPSTATIFSKEDKVLAEYDIPSESLLLGSTMKAPFPDGLQMRSIFSPLDERSVM